MTINSEMRIVEPRSILPRKTASSSRMGLYTDNILETPAIKYLQVLLPKRLVDEFIQHQHGMFGKHPGIAKVIQQCRERYNYPGLALKICQHISQCLECLQTKRTPNTTITPPLTDVSQIAMGPEDAMR